MTDMRRLPCQTMAWASRPRMRRGIQPVQSDQPADGNGLGLAIAVSVATDTAALSGSIGSRKGQVDPFHTDSDIDSFAN